MVRARAEAGVTAVQRHAQELAAAEGAQAAAQQRHVAECEALRGAEARAAHRPCVSSVAVTCALMLVLDGDNAGVILHIACL